MRTSPVGSKRHIQKSKGGLTLPHRSREKDKGFLREKSFENDSVRKVFAHLEGGRLL